MNINLYPLKFKPIAQYRIWGGDRLNLLLPKEEQIEKLGEIWSLSNVENNVSIVSNGNLEGKSLKELIETYQADLVGKKVWNKFKDEFPLLIKFIDSAQPLSVQVHPNDELAKIRHNGFGKSEMWYINEHEENAELILGFEKNIDQKEYLAHLENNTLDEILHHTKVSKGDVYYLPAGCVHAIGQGITLTEIQQTSDFTYRIYDYNRIDRNGEKRELHTELALDAIDFNPNDEIKTKYNTTENQLSKIIETPYFSTQIFKGNQPLSIQENEEMRILICTEGKFTIQTANGNFELKQFESMLIPAAIKEFEILPNEFSTLLEVKVS